MIELNIDGKHHSVPEGWSVATAVLDANGLAGYRLAEHNQRRAPVCHMGVCYECSVHVQGRGYVRGCMVQAAEGMKVKTLPAEVTEWKEPARNLSLERERIYDVVIIGAGPAGLGAADELAESDKNVLLLDEQPKAGGQIFKQGFVERQPVHPLISTVDQHSSIDRLFGHAVWSIHSYTDSDQLTTDSDRRSFFRLFLENHPPVRAKNILLATGAYDRMYPVKGWTLPGVMSAGGIQVLLKTQGYQAGQSVVLAGSHPFLFIVAKLLTESGVDVKGIAIAQSLKTLLKMSKYGGAMLHHYPKLKELKHAIQVLHNSQVPILFGAVPIDIKGEKKVESVTIKQTKANNTHMYDIPCEVVGMCYGFTPVLDLAKQTGCRIERTAHGTRQVVVDEHNQTSVKGIYAAGELTAVGGAERSETEGRLVGRNLSHQASDSRQETLKKSMKKWTRFAKVLAELEREAWDSDDFQTFHVEQLICKCEIVTAQDIRKVLTLPSHPTDLNSIKLETRCGMGLCQGKYCEESLYRLTVQTLHKPPSTDTFNGQAPVKAITIRDL